jgi:hypothetical protein
MSRPIQNIPVSFANTGIIIKSSPDEIPMTAYKMLSNAQTDRENSVSVRKGFERLNSGLPNPPHSAYFLKDYNNRKWRYAIVDGQLYVAPIIDPEDENIWPIASGTDFLPVSGASGLSLADDPRALFTNFSLSGTEMKPYIFLADGTAFIKHSGGLDAARRVGIPRPVSPIVTAVEVPTVDQLIDDCNDVTKWTGGSSTKTTAQDYPSTWWYGVGTQDARWLYSKYTFVLNDNSETFASSAYLPHYIPKNKQANMFWKPSTYSDHNEGRTGNTNATITELLINTYTNNFFDDSLYADNPASLRVRGVRFQHGTLIGRIQVLWETSDGTILDGPFHGGGGGSQAEFILDFDEYIIGIKGKRDTNYINSMIIVTNKRQSQRFGGSGGSIDYDISAPDGTSTISKMVMGFVGSSAGATAFQNNLTSIGFACRYETYDNTATPPGTAIGWNLYVGDSPDNTHKVNTDVIDLADPYQEPSVGFDYSQIQAPLANSGDLSNDASGHTDNAIKISLTGSGLLGQATKVMANSIGYPVLMDLGTFDATESFKFWLKFADATSLANCHSVALEFVLSNIPGDTGDKYNYIAKGEITDFSGMTAGTWQEKTLYKSDFVINNYGGGSLVGLDWSTVSAIKIDVYTKDPTTGSNVCDVSFDDIYFSPTGKLTGVDLQWVYTYYNSKTDTESDFSDIFTNPLGGVTNTAIQLSFPAAPLTNPPLANPDKIRLYRLGGTNPLFKLVAELDYVTGFPFDYTDNISDLELGKVLDEDNQLPPDNITGCEIYDDRLWTWGGIQDGISEPLNRLRFSKGTTVEEFPADNFIYVGSGNEEIQRVLEHDGELFVFTLTKVYRIVGQDLSTYRAVSTAVNQGLTNKFCACRGPHGIFMRAYDGIYEFPSGRKISEPINQVFFGEDVNGIDPVAAGRGGDEAMGFYDSKLFFSYCATTDTTVDNDRTLIWDIIYERWSWYIYGAQSLFFEPETNILVGCNLTQWFDILEGVPVDVRRSGNYPMKLEYGFSDHCSDGWHGIPCVIDTREYDLGSADQEKQFIDLTVDADTQGYPITILASFDGADFDTLGVVQTTGRQRIVLPVVMGEENSKFAVRMSLRISFESDVDAVSSTRLYKIAHRFLLEPPRHGTFVTDWSEYGAPGPKYFNKLWIEMDTYGFPLTAIEFQIDGQVAKTITDNITALGRQKIYYGLGIDQRGTLGRLKFITDGIHEIKLYDHGLEIIPEPPLVNTWQTQWTDVGFPYKKLWKHVEMDIDTDGKLIDFNFWLDGAISQSFSALTNGREHVVQSLDVEQFGKIGRITVDVPMLGTDGLPQGVRTYGDPLFIVEQRNPEVTIADSFEKVLENDRIKVLRRIWHVIDNPNEAVTLKIYVDNALKGTFTIDPTTATTPDLIERRIDMPSGFKGRLMRFIFTSSQKFEIDWQKCNIMLRDLNTEDGYRPPRLEPPATY